MQDNTKILVRALFISGFVIILGWLLSQTIGLGAGGFDSSAVLTQFNFYIAGGLFLLATLIFLIGLIVWNKGDEYGDSVCFVNQGRFPSLSIFKDWGTIRFIWVSLAIFFAIGIFMVVTNQKTFTGLRVLEHQFTPIGSIAYSSLLIPLSENFGAQAVIAASIVILTILAVKYGWNKGNYRVLVLIGIPILVAFYGLVNHLLRYGGSELSLFVVLVFWFMGGLITVLTGTFVPFWIMHLVNNLLYDLRIHFSADAVRNGLIIIDLILIVSYVYFYHLRKRNINNIYKSKNPI